MENQNEEIQHLIDGLFKEIKEIEDVGNDNVKDDMMLYIEMNEAVKILEDQLKKYPKLRKMEYNLEALHFSAVTGLRNAWNEYSKAIQTYLNCAMYNNDGDFVVLGDPNELMNNIKVACLKLTRFRLEVKKLKFLLDRTKGNKDTSDNKEESK